MTKLSHDCIIRNTENSNRYYNYNYKHCIYRIIIPQPSGYTNNIKNSTLLKIVSKNLRWTINLRWKNI